MIKGNVVGDFTPTSDIKLYRLDLSKLRPGDVILTRSPGYFESWAIRTVTWSDFSHAILVVSLPNGIEAADVGVERFRLDNRVARSPNNIKVLRPRPEFKFDSLALTKSADGLLERAYADRDAKLSILRFVPQQERGRFFCSQLVAQCFLDAGLSIVQNALPLKTTPKMIAKSNIFEPNKGAILETSASQLRFTPLLFDGPNTPTPNQEAILASQRAFEKVQPIFKQKGIDVDSRPMALLALAAAFQRSDPCAPELDEVLAHRAASISGDM